MPLDPLLGRSAIFTVQAIGPRAATLAAPSGQTVELPRVELPADAAVGASLTAFVHQDSDGRQVATTAVPRVERDQVAFLTATAATPIGAFFDWGLGKELLVPFAEQTTDVWVGSRHAVGLIVGREDRLVGTLRVSELLHDPCGDFEQDQWVEGEAWRFDPNIGLFVIVGRRFVGLVPAEEPHGLARGEAARFRVARVLLDGRINLSLRAVAHEAVIGDAARVLEILGRAGAPQVNDQSSPEELRKRFGLTKKAFKRAAGRLLREGTLELDPAGFYRPLR